MTNQLVTSMENTKDLHIKIELLRKSMIKSASILGIDHSNTICISQELDSLIVKYQKLMLEKYRYM